MTRKFTFLMTAMALIFAIMGPRNVAWGQRGEKSIEINTTNSGVTGSYADKTFDVENITFGFTQWMKNNNIQAKKSTTNSLYNDDAIPGIIKSITFVQTQTARAIKVYGGTSSKPTTEITAPEPAATMTFDFSGKEYTYFSMTTPGNACYFDKITITYEEGTPSTDPVINADDVELAYDATSGEISYSITNPTEGQSLTAELTEGDWISNLAVDAENSQVTFDAAVNTGTARTAEITLSYEGADDVVVTVTQKKFAVDYATLPFNWTGGGKSGLLALDGVTANGLGDDYAESHAPYRIKFDNTGDYIQIKTNEAIGTITIGVKMIGGSSTSSIAIKGSSDGGNFSDVETLTISGSSNAIVNLETTEILDASYRYVRMVFNKGSNVGVGPITIAKAETAYTVSIAQGIENGSISVSPTSAIAGRTITIEPTPIDGYVLDHYTISKTEDGTDVTGSVGLDGNTFTMPAYDVTISAIFTPAVSYTVTIANIQHGEIISVENEYAEGATVQLMVEPDANYGLASWNITKDEDESDTEIVPVYNSEDGAYEFAMPAYDITVSATFGKIATYTRITSIDQLIAGKPYIIIGEDGSKYYAMGSQANNNRPAIEIDADETTAILLESSDVHEFFISGDATNFYTFFDQSESGYLYAASSSSNHLKTKATLDNNGKWTIGFDETGADSIVAQGTNTRNVMQFNSSSTLFSCYASSSQRPVYLYMKDNVNAHNIYSNTTIDGDLEITTSYGVNNDAILMVTGNLTNTNPANLIIEDGGQLIHHNAGAAATFQKNITGYTGTNDNYYLIANPTDNTTVANLVNENGYDLYTFNPAQALEWNNEKGSNTLTSGTGYLYANSTNVTLGFAGILNAATSRAFGLVYAGEGDGYDFPGFNLIGNPFACNAYVDKSFYVIDGSELVLSENNYVAPCEGFFVEATEAGQSVTISTTAPEAPASLLSLSVSQNRGKAIDRAIVNFDGRSNLHKFMMNPNHTNISLAKNGEEFAAISTAAEGEMPVNFKAEKNGTYTITVSTENVDAEYLHLIDNMTGMDVDLLSTPSYTFEAKTSDYASRFKLVFGVNNTASESSDSNFAFMSDGNLVINNIEGEATLQIVDELGRVISTETVSGSYNKALNLKAGLYILNLNGMTQKIVVK